MIPPAAIAAARDFEHLTIGWDQSSESYAVYVLPRVLTEPLEVVERGFPTDGAAEDARHRIRAEKVLEAAYGSEDEAA